MQFLAEEEVWLSQPRCSKQTGRCKYAHKLNEIKIIRESQNSCFQYIYIFFSQFMRTVNHLKVNFFKG